jgi:hypothetical protein
MSYHDKWRWEDENWVIEQTYVDLPEYWYIITCKRCSPSGWGWATRAINLRAGNQDECESCHKKIPTEIATLLALESMGE